MDDTTTIDNHHDDDEEVMLIRSLHGNVNDAKEQLRTLRSAATVKLHELISAHEATAAMINTEAFQMYSPEIKNVILKSVKISHLAHVALYDIAGPKTRRTRLDRKVHIDAMIPVSTDAVYLGDCSWFGLLARVRNVLRYLMTYTECQNGEKVPMPSKTPFVFGHAHRLVRIVGWEQVALYHALITAPHRVFGNDEFNDHLVNWVRDLNHTDDPVHIINSDQQKREDFVEKVFELCRDYFPWHPGDAPDRETKQYEIAPPQYIDKLAIMDPVSSIKTGFLARKLVDDVLQEISKRIDPKPTWAGHVASCLAKSPGWKSATGPFFVRLDDLDRTYPGIVGDIRRLDDSLHSTPTMKSIDTGNVIICGVDLASWTVSERKVLYATVRDECTFSEQKRRSACLGDYDICYFMHTYVFDGGQENTGALAFRSKEINDVFCTYFPKGFAERGLFTDLVYWKLYRILESHVIGRLCAVLCVEGSPTLEDLLERLSTECHAAHFHREYARWCRKFRGDGVDRHFLRKGLRVTR